MTIREIRTEDLERCSDLYSRVFSGPPWSEAWNEANAYNRLNHFYRSEGFIGFLAEDEDVSGFVLGNLEPFLDGSWFYLREMCVDTKLQNQGVGTNLMSVLIDCLKLKDVKSIYLATEREIPAAAFYKKNGFIQEDKMEFYCRSVK